MIVPAGRINKLFGTEGGVMLSLYPAFPEDSTPSAGRRSLSGWNSGSR